MEPSRLKQVAERRELLIAIGFILSLLFLFNKQLYSPQKTNLKNLEAKIANLKLEHDALKKFALATQQVKTTEASQNTMPVFQKKISGKIKILTEQKTPEVLTASDFIGLITMPTLRGGIIFDAITQMPPAPMTGYAKLPFTLKAHGSFEDLIRLVDLIDKSNVLVAIDSIILTLTSLEKKEVKIELKADFYEMGGMHANNEK